MGSQLARSGQRCAFLAQIRPQRVNRKAHIWKFPFTASAPMCPDGGSIRAQGLNQGVVSLRHRQLRGLIFLGASIRNTFFRSPAVEDQKR